MARKRTWIDVDDILCILFTERMDELGDLHKENDEMKLGEDGESGGDEYEDDDDECSFEEKGDNYLYGHGDEEATLREDNEAITTTTVTSPPPTASTTVNLADYFECSNTTITNNSSIPDASTDSDDDS